MVWALTTYVKRFGFHGRLVTCGYLSHTHRFDAASVLRARVLGSAGHRSHDYTLQNLHRILGILLKLLIDKTLQNPIRGSRGSGLADLSDY